MRQFGVGTDSGGQLMAGVVVTIVYGLIAGAVAGFAGAARPYTPLPDTDDNALDLTGGIR